MLTRRVTVGGGETELTGHLRRQFWDGFQMQAQGSKIRGSFGRPKLRTKPWFTGEDPGGTEQEEDRREADLESGAVRLFQFPVFPAVWPYPFGG